MESRLYFPQCILPHHKLCLFTKRQNLWSKLKAFAGDKINVNAILKLGLERVENIVGKRENAGYLHFLLFPQCFQKPSVSGLLKVRIVW